MNIKFTLDRTLAQILHDQGLDPLKYAPAYDGESAGLDLYNAGPDVVLHNHTLWKALGSSTSLIPTGVHLALPEGTVGLVKERSSITKTGLTARAGVVDPGYTGQVFVNLVNIGSVDIILKQGEKLPVQIIVMPCYSKYEVIGTKEYLKITQNAKRAQSALGSTDQK